MKFLLIVLALVVTCIVADEYKGRGGDEYKGRGGDEYKGRGGDEYKGRGGDEYKGRGGDEYKGRGGDEYKGKGGDEYKGREGDEYKGRGGDEYKGKGGEEYKGRGGDEYRSRGGDEYKGRGGEDYKRREKYTDKYDSMDLDEILSNKRLFNSYNKCVLDQGKCTPEGKELKSHISDALQTGCEKCTDKQRQGMRKVIRHYVKNEQDSWKQMVDKYDPKRVYSNKYEKEMKYL